MNKSKCKIDLKAKKDEYENIELQKNQQTLD